MGRRPTFLQQQSLISIHRFSNKEYTKALAVFLLPAKESRSNGGKSVDNAIKDEDATNNVNSIGTSDKALEWEAVQKYLSFNSCLKT